jgi:hypothetical protein
MPVVDQIIDAAHTVTSSTANLANQVGVTTPQQTASVIDTSAAIADYGKKSAANVTTQTFANIANRVGSHFANVIKGGSHFAETGPVTPNDPTGGSSTLAKIQSSLSLLGFVFFIIGFWAMGEMCPGPFTGKKLLYLLLLIFGGGPVGFIYIVLAYGLKKKIC